jgi:FkbM family methyltransferase
MSWRTNRLVISLRNMARRFGINSFIMSFVNPNSYEDKFNKALLPLLKKGDVVWDIGANIGHYTKLFAHLTGSQGKVFAFEPSLQNYKRLESNLKDTVNVSLFPFALGEKEEIAAFKQSDDELGATSQVLDVNYLEIGYDQVEIFCGDRLVETGLVELPNFVKIDVEGFELEVINGIKKILVRQELKVLGIEVHFGLLNARSMADAPLKIISILESAGFSCSWSDNSHIIAVRI